MSIALITGGNSGIGKATALLFAQRGYKVAIAARRVASLVETQQQIEAQGGSVLAIATDVSCSSSVNQLVEQVIGRWE
jgi:NAD(P)-dependent dehydrogenase (short-subunit alcohol dehydrogenase family)